MFRGEGSLKGRLIAIPVFFETVNVAKPLWVVGIYGPTDDREQYRFWEQVGEVMENVVKGGHCVLAGDLNSRILHTL